MGNRQRLARALGFAFAAGVLALGAQTTASDPGFLLEHLDLLGSPDPGVRDTGFFTLLETQVRKRQVPPETMVRMLECLTGDGFLFNRIEDPGNGPACRRSFSVLAVAQLVQAHAASGFLAPEGLRSAAQAVLRYAREERNTVGRDHELGWIHASAHTADALAALARCRELPPDLRLQLLDGVAALLAKAESVYVARETWRMVPVFLALASDEGIPDAPLAAWLSGLGRNLPIETVRGQNTVRFLQDLYFGLKFRTERSRLVQCVEQEVAARMRL